MTYPCGWIAQNGYYIEFYDDKKFADNTGDKGGWTANNNDNTVTLTSSKKGTWKWAISKDGDWRNANGSKYGSPSFRFRKAPCKK